jgi:hypothetical protein
MILQVRYHVGKTSVLRRFENGENPSFTRRAQGVCNAATSRAGEMADHGDRSRVPEAVACHGLR